MDLADPMRSAHACAKPGPDIIVNAAAYTAVDQAEASPNSPCRSTAIAPGILAEEAKRLGALLVHYSTDYVFDGQSRALHRGRRANPLNVYGRSKLEGERAIQAPRLPHLILRTSWVSTASAAHNFLLTMLRLGAERPELTIVDDQRGAPTWARTHRHGDDAAACRSAGRATPPDRLWSNDVIRIRLRDQRQAGLTPVIHRIRSDEYKTAARRPANSVLDNTGCARLPGSSCRRGRKAWSSASLNCGSGRASPPGATAARNAGDGRRLARHEARAQTRNSRSARPVQIPAPRMPRARATAAPTAREREGTSVPQLQSRSQTPSDRTRRVGG